MAYLKVSKGGRKIFFSSVVHIWEIQCLLDKKDARYTFSIVRRRYFKSLTKIPLRIMLNFLAYIVLV